MFGIFATVTGILLPQLHCSSLEFMISIAKILQPKKMQSLTAWINRPTDICISSYLGFLKIIFQKFLIFYN